MSVLYDLKTSDLISPAYVALQHELHDRPNGYGGKGDKWAAAVAGLARTYQAGSILDYGCGEGALVRALYRQGLPGVRFDEYDPAVPTKAQRPSFADLVVCTDVLEHIEPDRLDCVLAHLRVLARKAVFLVVATRPSNKTMADGRNAHLIVEDVDWWEARVRSAGFNVQANPPRSPLAKVSREWVAVVTP